MESLPIKYFDTHAHGAVSYTHLVNIHSRLTVKPFKKMKGAGRLFLLKNVDRELVKLNKPVSYTHLDVYKRQG